MSVSTNDLNALTEQDELQNTTIEFSPDCGNDVIQLQTNQSESSSQQPVEESDEEEHDDDDEEEDEDDDTYDTKPHQVTLLLSRDILRGCVRSRACLAALYLCLTLLILAGVVAVLVVAVMVAAPYHRVAGFLRTTCKVAAVSWKLGHRQCSCGKGCSSVYPCLIINVIDLEHNDTKQTIIYENELMLDRQCSFHPSCTSSRISNENSVQQYSTSYGQPRQTYDCYYNPLKTTEFIRERKFHIGYVIHGLTWPIVFVLITIGLFIFLLKKKQFIILQSIYKP